MVQTMLWPENDEPFQIKATCPHLECCNQDDEQVSCDCDKEDYDWVDCDCEQCTCQEEEE